MESEFETGGENPGLTPDTPPEESKSEEGGKEEAKGGSGEGVDLSGIQSTLESLRSDMAYLKAENDLLRGQLSAPQKKEEEAKVESKEDVKARLAEDPVGAIEDLIEKKVKGVKEETSESLRLAEMKREDQSKTVREFGEYLEDPEFQGMAERAYREIVGARDWAPNALYLAASVAYSQLSKKGSIQRKKAKPSPAGVGEGTSASAGSAGGKDSSGINFTQEEMGAIDKVCKRWGISREKYMESFKQARDKDPGFGKAG